jgi:hypothetical protein
MDQYKQEQEIIQALRNLPVAVIIWPRPAPGGYYSWQCLDGSGLSESLAAAMSAGLTYLIEHVAGDAGALDDLKREDGR